MTGTERDPDLLARLRGQTKLWKAAKQAQEEERAKLDAAIVDAKESGWPFATIREVTGFGVATIQMVLARAGKL